MRDLRPQRERIGRPPFVPLALAVLLYVGAVLLIVRIASDEGAANATIAVAGSPETVFDWSSEACEFQQIPDLPVRAFRDYRGRVQLILPDYINRRLIGPSLDRLHVDCAVTMRSTENPDPAAFDYQEWIASVFTKNGRDVAALIHEEYRGMHSGTCVRTEFTPPCWYNAVTFARSDDGGRTFELPPDHFVAASTYRYMPRADPIGIFTPSNIVGPRDGYYYALVVSRTPSGAVGELPDPNERSLSALLVARVGRKRLRHPLRRPLPQSRQAPLGRACRSRRPKSPPCTRASLTTPTSTAICWLGLSAQPVTTGKPVTGIYFSLSSDLVHWSPRRLIMEATHDPHVSLRRPQPDRLPLPDRSPQRVADFCDHRPSPLPLLHPVQLRGVTER